MDKKKLKEEVTEILLLYFDKQRVIARTYAIEIVELLTEPTETQTIDGKIILDYKDGVTKVYSDGKLMFDSSKYNTEPIHLSAEEILKQARNDVAYKHLSETGKLNFETGYLLGVQCANKAK